MKHLIRSLLMETRNEKIIDLLKGRFHYTEFENIKNFLEQFDYTEKEIDEIFGDWFKMETGIDFVDYYKSKKNILVGSKTNFIKDILNRYDHIKGERKIYFFDNGYHFGTLYIFGSFMEFRHDGSVDINGRRK